MRKGRKNDSIGIILDCHPYNGGSFQYAISLLEAIIYTCRRKSFHLVAFVKNMEWESILEGYGSIELVKLNGSYYNDPIVIDEKKCELIFSSTSMDWCERIKTPVITPIHDLMHRYERRFEEVSSDGEFEKREWLFHSIVEKSIAVLADSNIGKTHICEIYGKYHENKIYKLAYAVPSYLDEKSQKIEIPFEKYIFYPAQFWKHKNHIGLIEAVQILKERGIEINLVFCGSKKNGYDEVKQLISQYKLENNICILGYVSNANIKYLYENARAMIMPTFFGPTNIPPIEAVTLGCPAAVSDIYGMREQMGDAVAYYNPEKCNEIAEVINSLWNDDLVCKKLVNNGKKGMSFYSQERFNEDVYNIFEKIEKELNIYKKYCLTLKEFSDKTGRLFVYGAGKYGCITIEVLKSLGIEIDGVVQTHIEKNQSEENVMGFKVVEYGSLNTKANDGFIVAVGNDIQDEIVRKIGENVDIITNVMKIDCLQMESIYRMLHKL